MHCLCFPVGERTSGPRGRLAAGTLQLPTAGRLGRATRARARVSLRNHTYLVQETNGDPQGRSPRVRPFHCTTVGLTFAIAPNVGDSGTLFLSVGSCVRARPRPKRKPKNRPSLPPYRSKCSICSASRTSNQLSKGQLLSPSPAEARVSAEQGSTPVLARPGGSPSPGRPWGPRPPASGVGPADSCS